MLLGPKKYYIYWNFNSKKINVKLAKGHWSTSDSVIQYARYKQGSLYWLNNKSLEI